MVAPFLLVVMLGGESFQGELRCDQSFDTEAREERRGNI
jgi:hypothetical protein